MENNSKPKLLVIGSKGALGSAITDFFHQEGYWIVGVDHGVNPIADLSIVVDNSISLMEQQRDFICNQLTQHEENSKRLEFDMIISVAGGWAGGNILDPEFLQNAELMWKQSTQSSLIAVAIAGKFLKKKGLLILTGAQAALDPTPGMITYGMAKAAVHHLVKSLGADGSGLETETKVLAILPITLDTPNNRKWMSDADFGTWTPLIYICGLLKEWIQDVESAPKSGSLVSLQTNNFETVVKIN